MCFADPLTMIAAGTMMAGSVIGSSGKMAEGRKAKEIADLNAKRQVEAGRYQAKQIRKKVQFINSRATAQAGARGLALSGSVLDVMMDTTVQGEIDAANTIKTANQQAHVSTLEGESAQLRANNTATSMLIDGFTGFLRMAG